MDRECARIPSAAWAAALAVGLWLGAAVALADTLVLTTGERLSGKVVSDEGSRIVFQSDGLGKITVSRELVATLERTVKAEAPEPPVVAEADTTKAPELADRTASELPEAETPPVVVPDKAKRDDLLRLWIDQGLRYQIAQPIRIPLPFSGGEELVREEVKVTGRVGVRASFDAAGFATTHGMPAIEGNAVVRALRLYTTGDWSPTTSFAAQFGVIDGNFYLHNADVRWRDVPWFGNLTFGYLNVHQTLENVLPFGGTTFMEPALPVLAFAPGNRMGLRADRRLWQDRGSLSYGLYSVGADPGLDFGDQTQSLLRPTARLTWLPIVDEARKEGRRLLHLGASGSLTIANDSHVRYRARPESFIAPYLVDTGELVSRQAVFVGTEALWLQGPLTLQAEMVLNRVNGQDRAHHLAGGYVSAAWALTGEEVAYNRTIGVPDRIIPIHDLSRAARTWGAWQVGLRLSYLDLTDGPIDGGRVTESTLGLNWWWNRYLRWQLNYHYAIVAGGLSPGHVQILQGRVQLMY